MGRNGQVYEFDEFCVDTAKRQLLRNGEIVPLYSKAFDVLLLLIQNAGQDLTRDQILEAIWPGQILEDSNLTVNISAIRKALGENAANPRYLITIPGRGYRLIATLKPNGDEKKGFVVTTDTISEVLVEEEIYESDGEHIPVADENRTAALERSSHPPFLSSGRPKIVRHPFLMLAIVACVAGLIIATVYALNALRSQPPIRFSQVKLRQLTNDGAVITAAISPDGKFFAFVHVDKDKESLRLGQMNGESPVELRAPAAVIYRGIEFAPDGSAIYYVVSDSLPNQHTLFRMPVLGGVPVKLRDGVSPFFSVAPDNKQVAFVRRSADRQSYSILVSKLDGTDERELLSLPVDRDLDSRTISWSPDASMLALGATPEANVSARAIFLLNSTTGALKQLTGPVWRELERTAWLKDGSGLLTVAASNGTSENRQIWLIDVPSGKERRVSNDLSSYDVSVSVTADSNQILAVEHQQINNVWIAPADDLSKSKQLTFGALNNGGGGSGLEWMPNGKILYVERVAQSSTLWTMDADGNNAHELTPTGANDRTPSVTADGRTIVFESDRGGTEDIWSVNSDGSNPVRLTSCGKNTEPNVSPDGQWVVYRSACDSTQAMWRVSINGGQPKRLTDAPVSWPWISADSKWVACDYDTGGKSHLAIIPIDGGPPAKLFEIAPLANFRYGIRWTPDGKAITYRDWGKGIWRQPIDGGPLQQLAGLPDEKIYSYGWSRDGKLFAFSRGVEIRDVVVLTNQP